MKSECFAYTASADYIERPTSVGPIGAGVVASRYLLSGHFASIMVGHKSYTVGFGRPVIPIWLRCRMLGLPLDLCSDLAHRTYGWTLTSAR